MKNIHVIFVLILIYSFAAYPQSFIKKPNKDISKSYPLDGTPLLYKQDQQVAQWIKAHPDYMSNIKMKKTAGWGFAVGSTHSWQAYNFVTQTNYSVSATCRGIGPHCYVFVEDANWNVKVNQAAVDSVVNEFENKTPANPGEGIYQMDVNAFGNPPDVDGDPRIIILILDIKDGYSGSGGYTAGYFSSNNEILASGSNQAEIYYMDCNPTDLTTPDGLNTALETCAHEFQHMINWNYHQSSPEWTFVNEGLSMLAEIYCGYPPEFPELYAGETNHFLFDWRTNDNTLVLNDYSRAQRYFQYWYDQFGIGIFKSIVLDNANHGVVGAGGLSYALSDNGQSLTLTQLFNNWLIANELNNKSVNPSWGYSYPGLPNAVAQTFYDPNVNGSSTIQNYAAEYLTFTNSKNLSITFTTSSKPVIKAIETGTGGSRVVDVPLNTAFSDPSYGTTYSKITFVVVDTVLTGASEVPYLDNVVNYSATGTIISNVTEFKWDNTEPVGYYVWTTSDTVCVTFDSFNGGKLDSIRVALRKAGSITGGVWQFTGNAIPTPLGKPLAVPITASIATTNPPEGRPYPVPWQNWTTVDLRSYNISTDQPFAVGFVIGSDPTTPGVMVTDYASSSAYHSFTYLQTSDQVSSPGWYYITTNNAGDTVSIYLIRAYVSLVTGVSPEIELTPREYTLSQNYPNPFNPSTKIDFALPTAGRVMITIYNQLGQKVGDIADQDYSAGYHSIDFNASNLASGIYYYRISAGNFVQTKKMILLK